MKEIRVPEVTVEGTELEVTPHKYKTGSVGYQTQRPNFMIDGKKYWVKVTIVEQGTKLK